MICKAIKIAQKRILSGIYASAEAPICESEGILKIIQSYSQDEVQNALGDFGARLWRFSRSVDISHPDISRIYNGSLVGCQAGTFSKSISDILKIIVDGASWNISPNIIHHLRLLLPVDSNYVQLYRTIDDVSLNQLHLRLSLDRVLLEIIRERSSCHSVHPYSFNFCTDVVTWDNCPENFSYYERYVNKYQCDIDEAKKRVQHFSSHGLTSMATEIEKSIAELENKVEQYYGFNKLHISDASIILAKMMGYECSPDVVQGHFAIHTTPDKVSKVESLKDAPESAIIRYWPRICPFKMMLPVASKNMLKLIKFLDNFPQMGGRPLFDHYRVLVPGLRCHHTYDYDSMASYDALERYQLKLEHEIIKSETGAGIILGEVDGDHYFVSYFI